MTDIQLGQFTITEGASEPQRLAAIFWGKAGDGKTTLAATARGNKLWLQFDDSGTASIVGLRKQLEQSKPDLDTALKNKVYVLDISKIEKTAWIAKFKDSDAFGITPFITDPQYAIKTVVIDSLTSLGNDVLNYAINYLGFKGASIHKPGLEAYGARLNYLKVFITNLLKLTAKYNLDIIFISHEGAPSVDSSGSVLETTLALGGNLPNETALQVGEVWYIRNSQVNGREIFVAPFQHYRPMKTRMFSVAKDSARSFKWLYDVSNPDPKFEMNTWLNQWEASEYMKQELPK